MQIVDRFSHLTTSLFGVQPSVNQQLEKYISLRAQCFVQLEIFFLCKQLKKQRERNLPMRATLHLNQSNNSISVNSQSVRIWQKSCNDSRVSLMSHSLSPLITYLQCAVFFSFRHPLKSRWKLLRTASQKGPTTFPGRQASPTSTSVSSVLSPTLRQ